MIHQRALTIFLLSLLSFALNAQTSKSNEFGIYLSAGYLHTGFNKIEQNELVNPSNEDDVIGALSVNYKLKNNFGILLSANFAEYSLSEKSYQSFLDYYYPNYFVLHENYTHYKRYSLNGGLCYTFILNSFEIMPSLLVGRYFHFSPLEPNLIIKEQGSNLTRVFDYHAISMKYLTNYSFAVLGKLNFKGGIGIHVLLDYCYFNPTFKYNVQSTEIVTIISEHEYERKLNLSSMNFMLGVHYNFHFKSIDALNK